MTSGRVDLVAILAIVVAVNVVAGVALTGRMVAILHLGAAVLAVGAARVRGYSADDLALSPHAMADGLRLGVVSATVIVVGIVVLAMVPFTRQFFSDERFVGISDGEVLYETAFRIPVVTALTEEILFRSVLLGVLLTLTTTRSAIVVHAAVFGLWHVVTTIGDLAGNDVTDSLATWGRVVAVVTTVVATGAAGVLFGWLRVRSGSVVAPWIAHLSFNAGTFLVGVVVLRNAWS